MKRFDLAILCTLLFLLLLSGTASATEVYDFNTGWMFFNSDKQLLPRDFKEHRSVWGGTKAATSDVVWPFTGFHYNEENFRPVDLPHDWSVEDGFYPEENDEQGYRRRGWGYYRKRFFVPSSWKTKHVELQFEGIATYSTFWLNQSLFHHNYSGYNTITMDITPMLQYGRDNILAIEVNAAVFEGWWYEGAGIYRNAKLIVSDSVRIPEVDGINVNAEIKLDGWIVSGYVNVLNDSDRNVSPSVDIEIIDPDGKKVETKRVVPAITEHTAEKIPFSFRVASPRQWSPETPDLYQLKVSIKNQSRVLEEKSETFGFRVFAFHFSTGFSLNGKQIKLKGVCNHQDHAGVGAAVPASIEEFRIRKLKEMGANAYRCAHNPPSKNILDLCDKYGLLVIDENRAFNAGPQWLQYVREHVRRDRNHPCVIAWSLFNEEPLQGEFRGQEIARAIARVIKEEDPTRPILAAMNGGFFAADGARNVLDVVGFNYQYDQIDKFHESYPNIPIVLTEGASAFETRGEYVTDAEKLICTSYDEYAANWGTTHRKDWETVLNRKFLAGSFVWTGFDYHGEPTPYNNKFPANSSYFGCMDLCGFPKTAFYIRQALWTEKPVLYAAPHWNWDGKEGEEIDVFVATNVKTVTFLLNGRNLGTFDVDPVHMLTQKVPYEHGTLVLIGKNGDREVIRTQIETTGEPVALKLIPDRSAISADGYDAVPVTVCALDASGRVVPTANIPVDFAITGPGRNIGVGNGDPTCTLSEKADSRPLFNGYAQIIIQSKPGKTGSIKLTATSGNLKSATCTIKTEEAPKTLSIDGFVKEEVTLADWKVSQATAEKPDLLFGNDGEISKLAQSELGNELHLKPRYWVSFYTKCETPPGIVAKGGSIHFKGVIGRAEFFLNGEKVYEKKTSAAEDIIFPVMAGAKDIEIVIRAQPDSKGVVFLGDTIFVSPVRLKAAGTQ